MLSFTSYFQPINGKHLGHFRPQDLSNVRIYKIDTYKHSTNEIFIVLCVQLQTIPPNISKVWIISDSSEFRIIFKATTEINIHLQEYSKIRA